MKESQPVVVADADGVLSDVSRRGKSQVQPRTVLVILLTALALLAGLYLLWQLRQLVRWTVIALFLAVTLDPAVNWLHRHRVPRGVAILLVYLLLVLLVVGVGAVVLPPLIDQVQGLGDYIVGLFRQPGGAKQAAREFADRYSLTQYFDTFVAQLSGLPGRLTLAAGPLLVVTKGVVGSLTALISILLMTFFLLLDGEQFAEAGLRLFDAAQRPRLRRILGNAARAVYGYITGNLAISLIAGVAAYIVLRILGMPYAVALALVVALFDLVPLVGATLGAAIVVIVGLFVDPVQGGILAVYFLLYQQLENNVLQPLVYGRSVRLHPLVIFIAVLAGGQLLGILGALLAIPVAEIIRILGVEWLASRRHDPTDTLPTVPTHLPGDAGG